MAVLIRDISKPKTCCACPCARENYCALTHYEPTLEEWYEDGVKDCPLVEVPEQKYGEWNETKIFDGFGYFIIYKDSVCGYENSSKTNYCPWCGAKMKMEEKESENDI